MTVYVVVDFDDSVWNIFSTPEKAENCIKTEYGVRFYPWVVDGPPQQNRSSFDRTKTGEGAK